MSFTKKYHNSRESCVVRFKLPQENGHSIKEATLVGDFNGWDKEAMPMRRRRDGSFTLTVELDRDKEYNFRYLLNKTSWVSDEDADKYAWCSFGGCENSIVVT